MKFLKKLMISVLILIIILNTTVVYATEPSETSKEMSSETSGETAPVADIDLGDYDTEMYSGKTQLLIVTVLPTNVTEQTVKFKSSKTNIATVNMLGGLPPFPQVKLL